MEKSREILKRYWGYEKFRPLQEEIVDSAIYQHDTLAILPTGGGKSICFQVPGLALPGLTLVISPLIALMEDQVSNLQKKGINASLITSSMSYREIDITLDNARFGEMKFLYTSPERLKSDLFRERCKDMKIQLIVVDEAHCISEWGHDFRPSYREISQIRELHPNVPIIALTASATQQVQTDIINQLNLKSPNHFQVDLDRENLSYSVVASEHKMKNIVDFCTRLNDQSGIIYCQTRRSVKSVVTELRALKFPAGLYHGGLSAEDRKYMLQNWMSGKLKIMVATNAFGMGIDKSDVRYVLHYEIPNNLEAYYQEAGRAGRDGKEAQVVAYWEEKDLKSMKDQLTLKYPEADRIKAIYASICNFMKIGIGSGNQEAHEFDIKKFHESFEFPVSETYYALKILQLNQTLSFNENSFHPTRLKFAIGNSALYKFQVTHESLLPVITMLTRSYPGIFDRFIRIDESELSKRLKLSKAELTEQLKFLEKYGVIDIEFQSNLPKITMLTDRLADGQMVLSKEVYAHRKKVDVEKLEAMRDYITSFSCRSALISAYFGSPEKKCGKCDICKAEQSSAYSIHDLLTIIPELLPATSSELSLKLGITNDLIHSVLHSLMLEEIVQAKDDLFIRN